jgi:hypothetical protein
MQQHLNKFSDRTLMKNKKNKKKKVAQQLQILHQIS